MNDNSEDCRMPAEIVENVPGGVCVVVLDEAFTLLYGNRFFYEMYGYTREQFHEELGDRLIDTIYGADIANLRKTLTDAVAAGREGFESEHRIIHRDGTLQWSLVRGTFSKGDEPLRLYCITVDITDRREVEEALRVNEERFHIALTQMDSAVFDYDIKLKRMLHGDRSAEKYGLTTWTENVPESLVESGVVHSETAQAFFDLYEAIRGGAPMASCLIKARMADGYYAWQKITMTTVFDGTGTPVRAVGFLENVDDQKRREDELQQRSERDTLTGLYNKGTTESRIEDLLRGGADHINALFIIDIDEFKSVNDHHGHMFGDRTLEEGARRLTALFHASDIVGRIGGDEFIVFMMNLRHDRIVEKRAKEICESFQKPFESGGDSATVSCSVGVAVSPRDGDTFRALYQRADIALYDAKKRGKNMFQVFEPGMEAGLQWKPYSNTIIDTPSDAGGSV